MMQKISDHTYDSVLSSPLKIVVAFVIYAAIHSILASRQVKKVTSQMLGERHRDGLFRTFYILQSLFITVPGLVWFNKLPDRTLYNVRAPLSWFMRAGQLSALGFAVWSARQVGLARITGLKSLQEYLAGREPESEPEAQGPTLAPTGSTMQADGPFRLTRHPLNFAPIPIFFLFPHMTVNRTLLAVLASLYLYAGSLHEEIRLRAAYGVPYERYQRGSVPFLVPHLPTHVSKEGYTHNL